MLKLTKIACVVALGASLAIGCGDDDDDDNDVAEIQGCTFDNDTCQESTKIGPLCESERGSLGGCSDEAVLGTCEGTANGVSTKIWYYTGETWDATTAQENCETQFNGTWSD